MLLLIALCVTSKDNFRSISVTRPADGGVYAIKSGTSTSVVLAFDHSFTDEQDANGVAFCFHILKTDSQFKYSENCFKLATREITINEIGPGDYILTTFLREFDEEHQNAASIISDTTSTRSFKVISDQQSVPLLSIQSDLCSAEPEQPTTLSFAADAKTNTAVAEVSFTLQKTSQSTSVDLFSICLTLLGTDGSVLVKRSCLSPGQQSAVLSNLPVGTYTLQASLKGPEDEDVIQSSIISASLQVYNLKDAVQSVSIAGAMVPDPSNLHLEYVVDTNAGGTTDTPIAVTIHTAPCTAEKLISLCLELYAHSKSDTSSDGTLTPAGSLLSRKCFASEVRTLTPQHLTAGLYTAVITLYDARDMPNSDSDSADLSLLSPPLPLPLPAAAVAGSSSALRVLLETRAMEELEPSYEWQRLHAWHTIPAGMDVR